MASTRAPRISSDELATLGTRHLGTVIAMDSQSDERSASVPSTEGQRALSRRLAEFFAGLGFKSATDASANLIVDVPASAGAGTAPKLALMVHGDTARGTQAVERLNHIPGWRGERIPYPDNERLQVTVDRYPETKPYLGEDLVFGPGRYPIGLDDKLGLAEMMTLAEMLAREPDLPRPPMVLVCRPDEEIGRMAAVEGLAELLHARGVRYGYTLDGIGPFEIQVENFNASRATVRLAGRPLELRPAPVEHRLRLRLEGCKSHGATAKAEGYLNATVLLTRAMETLPAEVLPVRFVSDVNSEVDADIDFLVRGNDEAAVAADERRVEKVFGDLVAPHAWKGARLTILGREPGRGSADDAVLAMVNLLRDFLASEGPKPRLSEESEGRQGYSNPYSAVPDGSELRLDFRLRAFDPEELRTREQQIVRLCGGRSRVARVEVMSQYINMGPSLRPFPELVRWATEAAATIGVQAPCQPIRGGTGVDPFLARGIPVANLGTGYFAPESEKEFTSRQKIAQHALWLAHLVQVVAAVS